MGKNDLSLAKNIAEIGCLLNIVFLEDFENSGPVNVICTGLVWYLFPSVSVFVRQSSDRSPADMVESLVISQHFKGKKHNI